MGARREFSPQALLVLAALQEQPPDWQHGYALASRTGLKSGTLYPILIRLADRGLVEARWQEEPAPARAAPAPDRLTADGARQRRAGTHRRARAANGRQPASGRWRRGAAPGGARAAPAAR